MTYWKEKLGHTTIDLGIAPSKLESYQDGNIKATDPMERLESVKGHLVSFPLDFMCIEDLRPVFKESEYYASPQVFHWAWIFAVKKVIKTIMLYFRLLAFNTIIYKYTPTENERKPFLKTLIFIQPVSSPQLLVEGVASSVMQTGNYLSRGYNFYRY